MTRTSTGEPAVAAASAEDVGRAYFDAVARRDPDAMAALWEPDGVDDLVPIGILRGPAEVRAFFAELFAALPDIETTVRRVTAAGEVACVEWRMTGTFSGAPFQGIAATGGHVELRGVDCVEARGGRIVRNTAYWDGGDFARQLGLLPEQGSAGERALLGAFNALTRARSLLPGRRGR